MNIYQVAKSVVQHGWMVSEKCDWFERLYKEANAKVAVETGCYYGMSAIAQGLIIKQFALDCKLYAIDAWSKEASIEGSNSAANSEWWSKLDYDEIYLSFLRHIRDLDLGNIVVPLRIKSQAAHSIIPNDIDIFHQDSNHSKEVIIEEIKLYSPKMRQGGYWICDDFRWAEAVEGYAQMPEYGFEFVYEHNKDGQSFAIYKKL